MTTIAYVLIMVTYLFGMDYLMFRRLTEKMIVRNLIYLTLWVTLFITIKNIIPFLLGGFIMVGFTDYYLIRKLYGDSHNFFTKKKEQKDAVHTELSGKEKHNQDASADKDQHITKDS